MELLVCFKGILIVVLIRDIKLFFSESQKVIHKGNSFIHIFTQSFIKQTKPVYHLQKNRSNRSVFFRAWISELWWWPFPESPLNKEWSIIHFDQMSLSIELTMLQFCGKLCLNIKTDTSFSIFVGIICMEEKKNTWHQAVMLPK